MTTFFGKIFSSIALSISSIFGLHSAPHATTTPTHTAVFASSTAAVSSPSVTSAIRVTSSPKPVAVQKTAPVASVTQTISTQSQVTTVAPAVVQTPPPNTTLCNGTYWSECPSGEDFVCPATGNATCQVSAATQATQQAAATQQQASQVQSQTQAQEAQLQPLENSFAADIQNIYSECQNASTDGLALTCESAESELQPILEQEAQIGISAEDAKPELTGIQMAYAKLQTQYYASPGDGGEAQYEAMHNNLADEMQILANDEAMFSN